MSDPEKTAEQAPRSFVNPDDFPSPNQKETPPQTLKVEGKEVHILKPEIALTLIYGKLDSILTEMKMLNGLFSKAAEPKTFVNATAPATVVQPAQPVQPVQQPVAQPQTPTPPVTEQPQRVKDIIAAFPTDLKDLLKIDTESSAMLVLVKPAQFLGSDNFAKVASTVRGLGGQYVSAGKNSHFEIPKAPLKK